MSVYLFLFDLKQQKATQRVCQKSGGAHVNAVYGLGSPIMMRCSLGDVCLHALAVPSWSTVQITSIMFTDVLLQFLAQSFPQQCPEGDATVILFATVLHEGTAVQELAPRCLLASVQGTLGHRPSSDPLECCAQKMRTSYSYFSRVPGEEFDSGTQFVLAGSATT